MANGILIIDKPEGWTSMDVCAKLRGKFHEKRVGHGGTLDPMATGVLPIFLGRATRAVEFSTDSTKEYLAGLKLGVVTNTQDTTGEVLSEQFVEISAREVSAILPKFVGPMEQIPPMYSAIKKDGQKLYDLARKGVEVERKPRPITIHSISFEGQANLDEYLIQVRCSKGTYIRTLCHDIGQALGCGGCMSALRRIEAGGYTLADCVTLEEVLTCDDPESLLRPVDSCFTQYPDLTVSGKALSLAKNGNLFRTNAPDGTYRVYDPDGKFLLLGRATGGQMATVKSFFEV